MILKDIHMALRGIFTVRIGGGTERERDRKEEGRERKRERVREREKYSI